MERTSWPSLIRSISQRIHWSIGDGEYSSASLVWHVAKHNKSPEVSRHSKLRSITPLLCGNQSAHDITEFSSVDMDAWYYRFKVQPTLEETCMNDTELDE